MSEARRSQSSGRWFEFRIDIRAPRELVWELLQDTQLRPSWDERVVSYEPVDPGPTAKGSRFHLRFRLFGVPSMVELQCITWDPPHRSAVRAVRFGRGSLFLSQAGSWQLVSKPDGVTEWVSRIQMRAKGPPPLARALERITGDYLGALALKSQEKLRAIAEARWRARVAGPHVASRSSESIAPQARVYES